MAGYNLQTWQEQRVLRFLNGSTSAEIQRVVVDDPRFGIGPPRAYGIRHRLAERIVARRAQLGGSFSSLAQVDALFGMGPDTLHDLLAALLPVTIPDEVIRQLQKATRVVVITGAGVSQPSGLAAMTPTQMQDHWTPKAFAKDVQGAWDFHLDRRDAARVTAPNQAHASLHQLGRWSVAKPGTFVLVTQNQDRLHHRAAGTWTEAGNPTPGTYPIVELHGHLFQGLCTACDEVFDLPLTLAAGNSHTLPAEQTNDRYFICSTCRAMARPSVQWLTEPYARGVLDVAGAAVKRAQVVLFLGTSGSVPVVRWLLHEAHWNARAYTVVVGTDPGAWTVRDGTPAWPGEPIVDAVIEGDIVDTLANLRDAVGW